MSDLARVLRRYTERQLPRVLTQLDRDPDSPTFGCFDRNYWHYKIRDFPSAILQQGVFTLEAVRRGALGAPGWAERAESWVLAALGALVRQADRRGGVDEYYPFERSYPAAAFGLYAAGRLVLDWRLGAPELWARVDREGLEQLARALARREETEAANQQAAGLAGLALLRAAGLEVESERLERHADRLFAAQHAEGWFPEYGGPDFGYLSVTLDALADYHDATGDPRALAAIERAVGFLASLVGADGRLPSTLNSRNTDYVVPYGLARAAARLPVAAWLVETLFRDAEEPAHFLWATDDRYHSHYVYASVVRALESLDAMLPPEPPAARTSIWLAGCGFWARWSEDRRTTLFVAARKGGAVRIHRASEPPLLDHGWRLRRGRRQWTTHWWSDAWQVEHEDERVRITGACQKVGFLVPTPLKHLGLRLAAWCLRERLIPLLKRLMIFRPRGAVGPRFERKIEIRDNTIEVRDHFLALDGAMAVRGPRQNLRHVASADSFSPEEMLTPIASSPQPGADELRAVWSHDLVGRR